ncbi:MAG: ribosome small subunit-dependent GTPase A [Bacteroidales bacterium]|nr:ribosome small subunit-dependent GTPase A [Bacteroidales bacterium]
MDYNLVIRNTGSRYVVLTPDGREITCAAKGNFRIRGLRTTNPVAVGDHVDIKLGSTPGEAFITDIHPRTNYIIRRASNLSKESHILAANIDQALLVVTLFHPTTSTTFIDRFLATAEAYGVHAVIAVNKTDLIEPGTDEHEYLEAFSYLYRSIGYEVIDLSARTGAGVPALRDILRGKITLLSGNSGVGKSTLINELIPGLGLRTGQISDIHGTGMHTTTFSEMFPLPDGGGYVIDTPGVKGFGTIDMDPREVSHYFPEIFATGRDCRFGDCTHTGEPGCAVKEALEDARIAQSRYASYLSILDDASAGAADKYRKPF